MEFELVSAQTLDDDTPKTRPAAKFACPDCPRSYSTKAILRQHARALHAPSAAPHACPACPFSSRYLRAVQLHTRTRHPEATLFACALCDYSTRWAGLLKAHRREAHPAADAFGCDDCGKTFTTKQTMLAHARVHMTPAERRDLSLKCAFCEKAFLGRRSLVAHNASFHFDEAGVADLSQFLPASKQCPSCDYTTRETNKLTRHFDAVHREDKPVLTCSVDDDCAFQTVSVASLAQHARLAHGEPRRFRCANDCAFETVHAGNLARHRRCRHDPSGAGAEFRCPRCDRAFSRRANMDRHVKEVHLDERDRACTVCDFRCSDQGNLRRHERLLHGGAGARGRRRRKRAKVEVDVDTSDEVESESGTTDGEETEVTGEKESKEAELAHAHRQFVRSRVSKDRKAEK